MSISKKIVAGMLAFAFAMGTYAMAADTVYVPVDGDNSIALWDAEEELEHMGLDPDNFELAGLTGREISEEMYPIEESQGD